MTLSQELPTARRDCRLSRLSLALLALESVPPLLGLDRVDRTGPGFHRERDEHHQRSDVKLGS